MKKKEKMNLILLQFIEKKRHLIQLVFNNPLVAHIYKEIQPKPNQIPHHIKAHTRIFSKYGLGICCCCCCLFFKKAPRASDVQFNCHCELIWTWSRIGTSGDARGLDLLENHVSGTSWAQET